MGNPLVTPPSESTSTDASGQFPHPPDPVTRISCLLAGLGWSLAWGGVVGGSAWAFGMLRVMGGDFPYHPMLDYWLRMTAIAFAFIGVLFLLAAAGKGGRALLFLLAVFQLICAATLLVWAVRLELHLDRFLGDVAFCLVTGIGILVGRWLRRTRIPKR